MIESLFPNLSAVTSALIVGILAMCLCYIVVHLSTNWNSKLPPGPFSLPIVGYLPFLGTEPFIHLQKLSRKYGKVFRCRLGAYRVVVVGGYKAARDLMANPYFLGRPPHTAFHIIPDELGMVTTSGQDWQEQRKITVTVLKYLTSKVTKLEDTIQGDVSYIVQNLEEHKGKPVSLRKPLSINGLNNMWYFLFGKKIPLDHPKLDFLTLVLDTMSKYFAPTNASAFLPWVATLFYHFKVFGYDKAISVLNTANKRFGEEIQKVNENPEESSADHFVSGYLRSMEVKAEKNEHTWLTINNLKGTLQGFFLAGSESTRTSVEWAMATMASYLDVQRRVQKEIEDVVGQERRVMWADRMKMPYTMATIMELQRWRTLVPISPPRYALEDTTIAGYHIPKGTTVLINNWAIHNDPEFWDNPEEFRPERFLTDDGSKTIKPDAYMPFNLGRRKCPGDEMALTTIFIYMTTLLQKFDVRVPEGGTIDLNSYTFGITYQPMPQEISFIPRETGHLNDQ